MGGLLHLVQQRGESPLRPLLAVPNVTAHPSTAGVPITVLLYNGRLLCDFNVPIKGLTPRQIYGLKKIQIPVIYSRRNADFMHLHIFIG